jgi:hypothetical protein
MLEAVLSGFGRNGPGAEPAVALTAGVPVEGPALGEEVLAR